MGNESTNPLDDNPSESFTYFTGEWVAKSKAELARPCFGYMGKEGPLQRDFSGFQTCVNGKVSAVTWAKESPTAQDAQKQAFQMTDKWLGREGPKLREATMEEIKQANRFSVQIISKATGRNPLKSYQEYRSACGEQRKGVGAKAPGERAPDRSMSVDR